MACSNIKESVLRTYVRDLSYWASCGDFHMFDLLYKTSLRDSDLDTFGHLILRSISDGIEIYKSERVS